MSAAKRVARVLERRLRQSRKFLRHRFRPADSTTIVFIVGCQRTGTNMTLQVFERSLDTVVYRRTDPRAFRDSRIRDVPEIQRLVASRRSRLAVFKPMNELQHTRRFLNDYADLRVIWMYRSLDDVVNSCVRLWTGMRDNLLAVAADPDSAGWFGEGLSGPNLDLVRRFASPSMSLESAYALLWYLRNSFYFDLELDRDPRVGLFRYEDLVREPEARFRAMFRLCQCPFDPDLTRSVFSSSVGRDAPPAIDPAIRELCEQLAGRFEVELGSDSRREGEDAGAAR